MKQVIRNTMGTSLARIERQLNEIPRDAYEFWRENTPVRSGNARRRTRFTGGDTIRANYPYAQRLDQGYSRQAPEGMSEPTTRFITRELRRIRK